MEIPIIDRKVFFGNPEITGARISPDGRMLSFIKPYHDVRNIWVKPADAPFEEAVPISDDRRPIPGYFWSRDARYILYVQDKDGDEDFCIYRICIEDLEEGKIPEAVNLTPHEGIRAMIYRRSKLDPDIMYIGLNHRDQAWHDLYKLSISTGVQTLLYQNEEQIEHYLFDALDQLRIVSKPNAAGGSDVFSFDEGELTLLFSSSLEEQVAPLKFHPDGNQVYVMTNQGERDKTELILYDLDTGTETYVHADPLGESDLTHIDFADETEKLLYTMYETDKPRYYFFDDETERDFNRIGELLDGKMISIVSATLREDIWLIRAYDDRDPGAAYLYDRSSGELKFLFHPRPDLPVEQLATVESIRYRSTDGLEIQAYLTLPDEGIRSGAGIVLVHGGPWARDSYGYHPYAQFLANRGYAVLQPNFRSSTGFGKRFLNAGNLEWGKKMQDDITMAAHYLAQKKYAEMNRIGIMGGSYGGYATLAALAFTPDVFAAGVDIVGPSNLMTLLDSMPAYWESGRRMLYMRVGNPETEEGRALLTERSPLFHAHKIKASLMVVQGANDPRVKKAEADQIVAALRDRGYPVAYLLAGDEGHGFRDPVNNMAMIAAIEAFFASHLHGRYQEEMPPNIRKRLETMTVDVDTVAS